MLVKDLKIGYRSDIEYLLGDKDRVKVCNNTTVARQMWSLAVELLGHTIVRYCDDSTIRIYSRGYMTATTKKRINQCISSRYNVFQDKGNWFVSKWDYRGVRRVEPFVEGMDITQIGKQD